MDDGTIWTRYASNTVAGTSNNFILRWAGPGVRTFRSYFKVRQDGCFRWRFWFSNTVDSTYADGQQAYANMTGGRWEILAAYAAWSAGANGSVTGETLYPVLFGGNTGKEVSPDERFWSDPVELPCGEGRYLVFTWSIAVRAAGDATPCTMDSQIPAYAAEGDRAGESAGCFFVPDTYCPKPNLLAIEKPAGKHITFLGDSITQGCGTTVDRYEYWVAKIAGGLSMQDSVWNLGLGYGRLHDAASGGAWLDKARKCDEINICLGINDILSGNASGSGMLQDLRTVLAKLKEHNPDCSIILFTIPPFNLDDEQEMHRKQVNGAIRAGQIEGADRVFDMSSVLCQPFPQDHLSRFDPHPGDDGGTEVAEAYLKWYFSNNK